MNFIKARTRAANYKSILMFSSNINTSFTSWHNYTGLTNSTKSNIWDSNKKRCNSLFSFILCNLILASALRSKSQSKFGIVQEMEKYVHLFSTNSSFYSIFRYIWIELSHQLDLLKNFNYYLLDKCQVSLIVLARTSGVVLLFCF